MSSTLLSKDITVTRCRPIVHTNLFKSNNSPPVVDDKYSFTRARNTLDSLITSIESLEPPSFLSGVKKDTIVISFLWLGKLCTGV